MAEFLIVIAELVVPINQLSTISQIGNVTEA